MLVDRFSTSSLIFVVLKLGLNTITDEDKKNEHALFFSFLFITDFITHWFLVYSKYLVGEETNKNENFLVRLYYSPLVLFSVCFLSELYTFTYYMSYFPNHFGEIKSHDLYDALKIAATVGLVYKNLINYMQLWASSMRIVSLDVEQKNANSEKNDSKKIK